MEKKKKEPEKTPYQPPVIRTIELAAEEVLAVGCKIVSAGGPNKPASCIIPSSCYSVGS